jgi:AcrR family transcriptional regulator
MPYLKRATPDPEPIDCRILTAALDLFVDRGYHNVSVHDVQQQANVSIGSIYKHFGGKEGIAKALYYHLLEEMEQMIDEVRAEHQSAIRRCEEIVNLLFGYTETHRNIIAFVLHAKHVEFLSEEPPICSAAPFRKMREIVEEGMRNGELQVKSPFVGAASIFGGAIRMIQLRLDGIIEQPLPELLSEVQEAMWWGMRADDAPGTTSSSLANVRTV